MLYILGIGAVFSAWSLLLILSGERQRQLNEALSANPSANKSVAPQKKN